MTTVCTHVTAVSGWTRDPETGHWVDANPACRKPAPWTQKMNQSFGESDYQGSLESATLVPTPETDPEESPVTSTTATATPTTFAEAETVLAQALPGYESRSQQQALARFIENILGEDGSAAGLAEAGCGTGKSLGGLIPAILASNNARVAKESPRRTVVATATIALMEQYANKDVPFLEEHLGVDFKWALLKGRSNYLCMAKATSPSGGNNDLIAAMLREVEEDEDHTGDREHFSFPVDKADFAAVSMSSAECPGKSECPFGSVCFAEKAKKKAREADLVITNTAMLMTDLKVAEVTDGQVAMLGEYDTVLIDEAHELEEIATSQLEEAFRPRTAERLLSDVLGFALRQGDIDITADHLVRNALVGVEQVLPGADRGAKVRIGQSFFVNNGEVFISMIEALGTLWEEIVGMTVEDERDQARQAMLAKRTLNMKRRYEDLVMKPDSDVVRWVEVEDFKGSPIKTLHYAPLNVAPFLQEWLWAGRKAVLVSATMSVGDDFGFIQKRLGLETAQTLSVGTPFDYSTQALLFVPEGNQPNPSKQRSAWLTYSAAVTDELIRAAGGGALLLFTSRTSMQQAYDTLAPRLRAEGKTVLIQGAGTNKDNARIFAEDPDSVLFALKSFFTGVDIPGDACRLVVIDKMPFPVPTDPIFAARSQDVERHGGSGFADLSIPMMTLTLEQGFGRLIRTKTDRGVVAILDSRLAGTGYGKKIVGSLPEAPATTNLEVAKAFYGQEA